jgi:hypothetical protein
MSIFNVVFEDGHQMKVISLCSTLKYKGRIIHIRKGTEYYYADVDERHLGRFSTFGGANKEAKLRIDHAISRQSFLSKQQAQLKRPNAPTSPGRAQDDGQAPATIVAAPVHGLVGPTTLPPDTTTGAAP